MNIFEKLLYFLQGEMEEPKPWGYYHILWIGIVIIALVFLYTKRNKYSEKQLKTVLGIYGIVALILEVLKQLIWAFNYDKVTGIVTWEYSWYSAPFQLCTMPIYVSLIALFLKKGKVRDSLLSFMAYTTILGSIATILIPGQVFTKDILVNIHTMYLHFGSFIVSIYLLMNKEVEIKFKSLLSGLGVFLIFACIANTMNIIVYNSGILGDHTFNMFYISPYFTSELPVFSTIQEMVPYPVFLFSYILGISLGSLLIYGISKLIYKIICRKDK